MTFIAILNHDTFHNIKCGELHDFIDYVKSSYDDMKGTRNEGLILFYKYLSEKFTEWIIQGEESKYIFTSTFSNLLFRKLPNIAGILYQSVKMPETYNLAIKPKFFDKQYFKPTHFLKQTFFRTNITELTEIRLEHAISFDIDQNIVNW